MTQAHVFLLANIQPTFKKSINNLRAVVADGVQTGLALPALSSSLAYIDSISTAESSANIIQGLRDYFGAHSYARKDTRGTFHTDW